MANVMETLKMIDAEKYEKYYDDIEKIAEFVKEKGIIIPEELLVSFWNHILMMIYRIDTHEFLNLDEENILNEVKVQCLVWSKEVLKPLFKKYGVDDGNSEEILLALYFSIFTTEREVN